ncbi:MAG TPA: LCP family protein [Thermosynechococcaceae cyanobacterium]
MKPEVEQLENRKKQPNPTQFRELPLRSSAPIAVPQPIPPFKSVVRGIALATTMMVTATVGLATALMVPLPNQLAPNDRGPRSLSYLLENGLQYQVARPVNILVMGVDRVPEAKPGSPETFNGRSDTMLLVRIDPNDDSVRLLSIPRDTQVEIPGVGVTKINDANARGGSNLALNTVSRTLNGVEIDRYVRISTEAFRELVNLLGGIEVYVPSPMAYEDKTQKLKINLAAGLQTLNGSQAEQFARFRQDGNGDIGRVQRQQALLKALLKKTSNPLLLPRLPEMIQTMQQYIDTNLSVEEMLSLAFAGRKLTQSNFKMVMLPGRFSSPNEFRASYWIMNPEGRDRVIAQYFDSKSLTSIDGSPRAATAVRIALQNASSQPDAAQKMRRILSKLGFQNVYIAADWAERRGQTQVIVQQGDLEAAKTLRNALGFGTVEADSTGEIDSDLTLRIGDDWLNASQP